MDAQEQQRIKQSYRELRKQQRRSPTGVSSYPIPTRSALEVGPEEREQMLEAGWARGGTGLGRTFNDVVRDPAANEVVADFVRRKIRSKVTNPEVAEALTPRDHYIATKRICVDSDYYETYDRPNVTLVDLRRDPLVSIEAQGVRTRDHLHAVDVLVYAPKLSFKRCYFVPRYTGVDCHLSTNVLSAVLDKLLPLVWCVLRVIAQPAFVGLSGFTRDAEVTY
jgi:cyclohexanone monooxygenase